MKRIIGISIILFSLTHSASGILIDFNHFNARYYGTAEALLINKADLNNIEIFPASLSGLNGVNFSAGYINNLDLVNIYKLNYAKKIGKTDTLGASLNMAGLKEIDQYDENGSLIGNLDNNDFAFNMAYARQSFSDIQFGINLRYIHMKLNHFNSDWIGFGVSSLTSLKAPAVNNQKDTFNIGLGIQNITIKKVKTDISDSVYPMDLYTGFIYKFLQINNISLDLGSTLNYKTFYDKINLSIGTEIGWKKFIFLRSGIYIIGQEYDGTNAGLGIKHGLNRNKIQLNFDLGINFNNENRNTYIQIGINY